MYDTLKCVFLSGTVTLFANVPEMFEMPMERIGFGALLFFIIWTYMKTILPKTHEEMQKLREENRNLFDEIKRLMDELTKLNILREKDQKIIASLSRESKQEKNDSAFHHNHSLDALTEADKYNGTIDLR